MRFSAARDAIQAWHGYSILTARGKRAQIRPALAEQSYRLTKRSRSSPAGCSSGPWPLKGVSPTSPPLNVILGKDGIRNRLSGSWEEVVAPLLCPREGDSGRLGAVQGTCSPLRLPPRASVPALPAAAGDRQRFGHDRNYRTEPPLGTVVWSANCGRDRFCVQRHAPATFVAELLSSDSQSDLVRSYVVRSYVQLSRKHLAQWAFCRKDSKDRNCAESEFNS